MDANYLLAGINSYNVNIAIDTSILSRFEKLLLQSQPLLNNVFYFIDKNYQQSISLREVAEAVGRSPAYLTDLVRRETGKTVLSWIIEHRMAEARRLLVETDQSVERITEAVGYFDRRHFSRLFLRFHNVTPQVWRRTHQRKSVPLWQIGLPSVSSSKFTDQKGANVTVEEAQRLQVCCQEIAVILNKNYPASETIMLEAEYGSVVKTGDGSIHITLVGFYQKEGRN